MFKVEVIGNLGADAIIQKHQGREFVSFRVAHSDRWTDQTTGEVITHTIWVSCALNGNGGNLTQYLKKGVKVFVRGNGDVKIYSSPKTHRMEAGVNVSVSEIELCGSTSSNQSSQKADVNNPSA